MNTVKDGAPCDTLKITPHNKQEAFHLLMEVRGDKSRLTSEQVSAIEEFWAQKAPVYPPVDAEGYEPDEVNNTEKSDIQAQIRQEAVKLFIRQEDDDFIIATVKGRNEDAGSLLSDEEVMGLIEDARAGAVRLYIPFYAQKKWEYTLTDLGNAGRLLRDSYLDIRHCPQFNSWYIWDGKTWQKDEADAVMIHAATAVKGIYREAGCEPDDNKRKAIGDWAIKSESYHRRLYMVKSAEPYAAVRGDAWDAQQHLFNCLNGTLDLDRMEFREHRRDDMLTKMSRVTYDPDIECHCWHDHLDLIFSGEQDVIQSFQQMCGYTLLADNPEQIMFILHGSGKNGKSKTLGVINTMMGDYAKNVSPDSLMVKRNESPRSDIARLVGCRMVTSVEGEDGSKLAESLIKQVTGGDTITVRFLYQAEFEYRPGYKIWLATNHKPMIKGTDEAIWRRIWLIPFEVTIPEKRRDPKIEERLLEESSGIFNWMIEGLKIYRKNGNHLQPPAKVIHATSEYRQESDSIREFLNVNCRKDPAGEVARGTLYSVYQSWCRDNDDSPLSTQKFAVRLREKGITDGLLRRGVRYWKGLRIREFGEMEQGDGIDQF